MATSSTDSPTTRDGTASPAVRRLYGVLVNEDDDHGCGDLPESACRNMPGNAVRLVGAMTLQKIGDRVVDPKTVLTWLLTALSAPAGLTGMLVPVRESGSLLPQAALVPLVRRMPRRKWVWVAGAAGQTIAVAAMALVAATASGAVAGWAILGALAVFALSRSLSSISSKDVLGRTVAKGKRGQITGAATLTSGLVAITVGIAIRVFGGQQANAGVFAWLLAGAALMWVLGAAVFASLAEPAGEHDTSLETGAIGHAIGLLRDDPPFRRFVVARTLLLVSALTPPFVVTLATQATGSGFGALGPFVIAQGLASLVGGRLWGRYADRSSKTVIMAAAGVSSLIVVGLLAVTAVTAVAQTRWLYPLTYFLLALTHTGSRIGRKTYVVDLAEGNRRTDYVAVSNTAMGVLLLVTGGISAAIATLGVKAALGFLAALGAVGVPVARSLPEVSIGRR